MRHLQILRAIISYLSSLLAPVGVFLDFPPSHPNSPCNFDATDKLRICLCTPAFGGPQSTIMWFCPSSQKTSSAPCWECLLQLKRLYLLRAWAVREGCYRGNVRGYFSKLSFSKDSQSVTNSQILTTCPVSCCRDLMSGKSNFPLRKRKIYRKCKKF